MHEWRDVDYWHRGARVSDAIAISCAACDIMHLAPTLMVPKIPVFLSTSGILYTKIGSIQWPRRLDQAMMHEYKRAVRERFLDQDPPDRKEWETKTMHRSGKLCVSLMFAAICMYALGQRHAEAADKVTFVTDFGYNGRHAYYFVALEKGYYARQNLDVQIVRGQGSADAVKQVAAGTAQIGFADTAAVILGRANDQIPTKLVAIVYAKPPHAIYVLKESGIAKPKDLEGKKLADTAFSAVPKLFDAYAKAANIDASKVTWLVAAADTLPGMLTTGRADGIGQFTVGEPLLAKSAAPKQILALSYADAGLDLYGNGIITSDSIIKSNPDLVRRFVSATMQGLKDAIANPQEAGAIMNKHHREVDADVAAGETKIVGTLTGQPLGVLDGGRVKRAIDIVSGAYTLKFAVTPEDIYAPGFVN